MWGVNGKFTFGNNVLYGEFDPPVVTGSDKFAGWFGPSAEHEYGIQGFIITGGPVVDFQWGDDFTFGEFTPDIKEA